MTRMPSTQPSWASTCAVASPIPFVPRKMPTVAPTLVANDQIEHQPHVLGDVLRQFLTGPRKSRLVGGWMPAFECFIFLCAVDAFLDVAD